MMWYLIFMAFGALVFGAGIAFEKIAAADVEEGETELPDGEFDTELYRQWANLFDYDGTEQEDVNDEE